MTTRRLRIRLNQQQFDLIERTVAAGMAPDPEALMRRSLREYGTLAMNNADQKTNQKTNSAPTLDAGAAEPRSIIAEHILAPGTGKALELHAGEVLRIEQIEGPQCVDFNCFNLHDYKEVMHVGRMRAMYGLVPTKGHFIWSAPPRERAMMYILEDTVGRNDVMFSRCNAYLYESVYGFASHTNCHDIQAEAQREYGLTPDDVHDSFNMFMCTEVKDGRLQINRLPARQGDYMELLALMDVLAVPNVCGNDVGRSSNFSLKPVKVSIHGATAHDLASVPPLQAYPRSQRTPAAFRQPTIKGDRPLRRDESYLADFTNVPLKEIHIELALDQEELRLLHAADLAEYYGDDEAAMLRDLFMSWWERMVATDLPGTVP